MIALNSRIQLLHFDTQSPFPGAKVGPSDKTKTQRHIIRKKKKINKSDPMMKNKIRDISINFVKCFLHQTATRYCCCCCCCCSLSDGSVFYEFQNGRERERETGGREGRGNFVGTRHVPWISSAVHVLLCVCVCVCVLDSLFKIAIRETASNSSCSRGPCRRSHRHLLHITETDRDGQFSFLFFLLFQLYIWRYDVMR